MKYLFTLNQRVSTPFAGNTEEGVITQRYVSKNYTYSSINRYIVKLDNGKEIDRIERSITKV
jgi:hypothetical protein